MCEILAITPCFTDCKGFLVLTSDLPTVNGSFGHFNLSFNFQVSSSALKLKTRT